METQASTNPNDMIGKRVIFQDSKATVRYVGPLRHLSETEASLKQEEIWVGVEWDEKNRGKHNGTVNGHQYFSVPEGQGSLLKKSEKIQEGRSLFEAIILKYFKEEEARKILELKSEELMIMAIEERSKVLDRETEEASENRGKEEKKEGESKVQVEYDEEGFVETLKKNKKMIEFLGFEKIWKIITNLSNMRELSLARMDICDVCQEGVISKLLPSLSNLSLEDNLLFDWQQIMLLAAQLPGLRSLSLSGNRFRDLDSKLPERIFDFRLNRPSSLLLSPSLKNITTLVLVNSNLTWRSLSPLLPLLPEIEELSICRNQLSDFQNAVIPKEILKFLYFLDLTDNDISDFTPIIEKFGHLPLLEKLNLNNNKLTALCSFERGKCLAQIKHLSIDFNNFTSIHVVSELSQFPLLSGLRVKNNPFVPESGALHVRQRIIAENEKLQILNGSPLKPGERKDAEVYYLRSIFGDFFKMENADHLSYNLEKLLAWAKVEHPSLDRLMSKFGNPYPPLKHEELEMAKKEESMAAGTKGGITLSLMAGCGAFVGCKPIVRKFPRSLKVSALKQIAEKLFNLEAAGMVIRYRAGKTGIYEMWEDQFKNLDYYGAENGGEVLIDKEFNEAWEEKD